MKPTTRVGWALLPVQMTRHHPGTVRSAHPTSCLATMSRTPGTTKTNQRTRSRRPGDATYSGKYSNRGPTVDPPVRSLWVFLGGFRMIVDHDDVYRPQFARGQLACGEFRFDRCQIPAGNETELRPRFRLPQCVLHPTPFALVAPSARDQTWRAVCASMAR